MKPILLILSLLFTPFLMGAEKVEPMLELDYKLGGYYLNRGDFKFFGPLAEAGVKRDLGENHSLSLFYGQGYSINDGLAALYQNFSFNYLFHLVGANNETEIYHFNGGEVEVESKNSKLSLRLSPKQYFFNFSDGAVGYSGVGTGVSYEDYLWGKRVYLELGLDYIRNSQKTMNNFTISFTLGN